MGFKASIEAEDGHFLLGGVKTFTTASFEEMRHAQLRAAEVYKANKAAGRRLKKGINVFQVNYVEITADEVYDGD